MILQTSFAEQMLNIVTLIGTIDLGGAKTYSSIADVAHGYRRFLGSLAQRPVNGSVSEPQFVDDASTAKTLARLFSNDSLLDDKGQSEVIDDADDKDAESKRNVIASALNHLARHSPQHAFLFRTIVTDILVRPSVVAKGGSTSQAIGVVWLNPKPTYSAADVAEILVHELTHHAMFLDELRYSHYRYQRLFDSATWTTSAILGIPRPLDKTLHSIVVAIEILLYRNHVAGHPAQPKIHPPSAVMIDQLRGSIASTERVLSQHHDALRPRADQLLRNAKSVLERLEQSVPCCQIEP